VGARGEVRITYTPVYGSEWSTTDNPTYVIMNTNITVTANFNYTGVFPTANITGWVYEANASPLDGATVNLTGPEANSTTTNASGYYNFTVNATGDYTVNVTKGGLTYSAKGVNVTAMGQNYTCNFSGVDAPYRTAPDILYCLKCSNLWLYGASWGEFALDATRVSDILYAWKNPS